jgi:integrase
MRPKALHSIAEKLAPEFDGTFAAETIDRLTEVGPDGLMFPSPGGQSARRSNYGRNLFDPAADAVGCPAGYRHLAWKFHSLRHVFATWAVAQPGLRIDDVSRLLGHSSTHVTQDIDIHVHGDLYQRFYEATE